MRGPGSSDPHRYVFSFPFASGHEFVSAVLLIRAFIMTSDGEFSSCASWPLVYCPGQMSVQVLCPVQPHEDPRWSPHPHGKGRGCLLRAGCSGGRLPSLGRRGQLLSLVRGVGWALSGWPPWTAGQMRGAVRHPPSPGPWPRGLAGLLEPVAEGCGSRSCRRVAGRRPSVPLRPALNGVLCLLTVQF